MGLAQSNSAAQQFYFVDIGRAAQRSLIGQAIDADYRASFDELRALDQRTTAEFNAEEDELTKMRDEMSFDEFKPLAEAFDQKSTAAREDIDRRSNEINQIKDDRLRRLLDFMEAEIRQISINRGNVTILNSAMVFAFNPEDDLTDILIARLNESYRNGTDEMRFILTGAEESNHLTPSLQIGETSNETE